MAWQWDTDDLGYALVSLGFWVFFSRPLKMIFSETERGGRCCCSSVSWSGRRFRWSSDGHFAVGLSQMPNDTATKQPNNQPTNQCQFQSSSADLVTATIHFATNIQLVPPQSIPFSPPLLNPRCNRQKMAVQSAYNWRSLSLPNGIWNPRKWPLNISKLVNNAPENRYFKSPKQAHKTAPNRLFKSPKIGSENGPLSIASDTTKFRDISGEKIPRIW